MARSDEFQSCLCQNFRIFQFHLNLKVEQHNGMASPLQRNDVLAVLPTGLGKSLIYQLLDIVAEIVRCVNCLAPVAQRLDNTIHRINRYPADKC